MSKFVMLGEMLAVAADDVAAFSQGVDHFVLGKDGVMSAERDLRIWLKSSDCTYDQHSFIIPDKDGELFDKLKRVLEAG